MTMRPEDVTAVRFREGWRGYDEDEVDDFMSRVAHALQVLTNERDEAVARAEELARAADEVRDNERLLQRTLMTAERTAEETIRSARAEADQVLSDARAEAERVRIQARDEARAALQQASHAVAAIRQAIEDFRAFRDAYRGRLHGVIQEHLAALERVGALPDLPPDVGRFEDLDALLGGAAAADPVSEEAPSVLSSPPPPGNRDPSMPGTGASPGAGPEG